MLAADQNCEPHWNGLHTAVSPQDCVKTWPDHQMHGTCLGMSDRIKCSSRSVYARDLLNFSSSDASSRSRFMAYGRDVPLDVAAVNCGSLPRTLACQVGDRPSILSLKTQSEPCRCLKYWSNRRHASGLSGRSKNGRLGSKNLREVSSATPQAFRERSFQNLDNRLLTYLARSWWICWTSLCVYR